MKLDDMNWMGVETYLQNERRLMVVLGSCEQHGYLSLACDTRIPLALAEAASRQSGVLIAPPLPYGVSPYFTAYPGTVSLRLATYLMLVQELVEEFHRQGFTRLLILNGHGGNGPAADQLNELVNLHPDLRMRWYAWWEAESVAAVARAHGLALAHANWSEAFAFTRVCELPGTIKAPFQSQEWLDAEGMRRNAGDGCFGGAYQSTDEVMQELFEAAVRDVLQLLDELK
jgi:creatinine amidohydrolase